MRDTKLLKVMLERLQLLLIRQVFVLRCHFSCRDQPCYINLVSWIASSIGRKLKHISIGCGFEFHVRLTLYFKPKNLSAAVNVFCKRQRKNSIVLIISPLDYKTNWNKTYDLIFDYHVINYDIILDHHVYI